MNFRKFTRALNDQELGALAAEIINVQRFRAEQKVETGDYEPLNGPEYELLMDGKFYRAVSEYRRRIKCSPAMARLVVKSTQEESQREDDFSALTIQDEIRA